MRFWDSSAMVPLLLEERRSGMLRAIAAADGSIAVWWGSSVECCSAVGRLRREGIITVGEEDEIRSALEALAGCWTEIEPTADLRRTAARLLLNHPLRAADALQLSAALAWSGDGAAGHEFVCLDERLRLAARNEGFSVLPAQGDDALILKPVPSFTEGLAGLTGTSFGTTGDQVQAWLDRERGER